ncbi:MAG: hypothetical protein IPM16_01105 [Chloroflexi bacterium]|nr:hypothetical protein [Chloroflexota bacterium]
MRSRLTLRSSAIVLSAAALLSCLGRTFLDYGYVFPEFGVTMPALLPITLALLGIYGAWIWALLASARGIRAGLALLTGFNLIVVLFGVSTMTTLCPLPCGTVYPLSDILIWANVGLGTLATLAVARVWLNFGSPTRAAIGEPS